MNRRRFEAICAAVLAALLLGACGFLVGRTTGDDAANIHSFITTERVVVANGGRSVLVGKDSLANRLSPEWKPPPPGPVRVTVADHLPGAPYDRSVLDVAPG